MTNIAIVPAAGSGSRFGATVPKVLIKIDNKTMLEHSLQPLINTKLFDAIFIALPKLDELNQQAIEIISQLQSRLNISNTGVQIVFCEGGLTRAQSVIKAMQQAKQTLDNIKWAVVHDGARPCLRTQSVLDLLSACEANLTAPGGLLASPAANTLKQVKNRQVCQTLERSTIVQALTPQCFDFDVLFQALSCNTLDNITDESSAVEQLGLKPLVILDKNDNLKVTYPEDLAFARFWVSQKSH